MSFKNNKLQIMSHATKKIFDLTFCKKKFQTQMLILTSYFLNKNNYIKNLSQNKKKKKYFEFIFFISPKI